MPVPQLMERRYRYSRYSPLEARGPRTPPSHIRSYCRSPLHLSSPRAQTSGRRPKPKPAAWQLKSCVAPPSRIEQRAMRHNMKGAPHKGAAAMLSCPHAERRQGKSRSQALAQPSRRWIGRPPTRQAQVLPPPIHRNVYMYVSLSPSCDAYSSTRVCNVRQSLMQPGKLATLQWDAHTMLARSLQLFLFDVASEHAPFNVPR